MWRNVEVVSTGTPELDVNLTIDVRTEEGVPLVLDRLEKDFAGLLSTVVGALRALHLVSGVEPLGSDRPQMTLAALDFNFG